MSDRSQGRDRVAMDVWVCSQIQREDGGSPSERINWEDEEPIRHTLN